MSQQKKNQVAAFLHCAYTDAKKAGDTELMDSLARATVAFSYSGAKKNPTLKEMLKDFQDKKADKETAKRA